MATDLVRLLCSVWKQGACQRGFRSAQGALDSDVFGLPEFHSDKRRTSRTNLSELALWVLPAYPRGEIPWAIFFPPLHAGRHSDHRRQCTWGNDQNIDHGTKVEHDKGLERWKPKKVTP